MSADLQEELSEADMSDEWKICKNGDAEAPLFCNIICKSYKYIFFYYIIIYMIIVAQALLGLNGRLQAAMALPRDSLAARMLQRGTLQALNLLSKARGLAT